MRTIIAFLLGFLFGVLLSVYWPRSETSNLTPILDDNPLRQDIPVDWGDGKG